MNYLCEEIVIEILGRLPAKSLVRFMAVCRLWKSIITSPQFLLSKRPTKLLVHTYRECYSLVEDDEDQNLVLMFETDFPLNHYSYGSAVLMGSDNGLLCIGTTDPKRGDLGDYSCVIIWNPSIRKHVVIPNNPMYDDNITRVAEYAFGFGGTISGSDYKYVSVVGLLAGGRWKKAVGIYSLKTGTWRRKHLDWDITQGIGFFTSTCAFLRGRLHWIANCAREIFSFELEDEVFEDIIVVPESIRSCELLVNVTVIRESLAVITNEIGGHSAVWVMEEYGDVNSWIKLCNIDVNVEILERVKRNMVHLLKNGELLLGLAGTKKYPSHLKLVTYNPKTMETRHFGGGSLSSLPQVCGFTHYYKESLVLLGDDRAAAENQQPTLQDRQQCYNPVMTGGACSYPLDQNWPMFFQPLLAYFPVWTGGAGFHWYPLFQDQYGSYYAWTGFHWLQIACY